MRIYLDLLKRVLEEGQSRGKTPKGARMETKTIYGDKRGIGTLSLFGESLSFDLTKGFPLVTTKKIYTRSLIYELLWFLRGEDNIAFLKKHKVGIWDAWADKNGNLGPTYGVQWRKIPNPDPEGQPIDQIANAVEMLRNQPESRRIVVSAWNPAQIDHMALPPCHCFFQFYVDGKKQLSCSLYQRSADVFLGVPFNIASYALLTTMMAQITNLKPHRLIMFFGDIHLYKNHIKQAQAQLNRSPYKSPLLCLDEKITKIDDFIFDSITIENYKHHDALPAPISI